MNKLATDDMRRVISFLPKDLVKLMRENPIYLAGGFLRAKIAGEPVNDVDLFCPTKDDAEKVADTLSAGRQVVTYRTRNAYTVIAPPRSPVQFIHRWTFSDPAALIASFDFTVAQACVWFDRDASEWRSLVTPVFYRDLAAKRLVYVCPERNEDAGGSILRVQKFLKRGYDISPEQFGRVMARLVTEINPETRFWEESETAKAAVLVGLLRQADPLTVIDGLEPSDDSLETPPVPQILEAYVP